MSDVYESILRGLKEAADDASGKEKLPKQFVTVNADKSDSQETVKRTHSDI